MFHWIFQETVAFPCQCGDSQGDRSQGNEDHLTDLPERVSAHILLFLGGERNGTRLSGEDISENFLLEFMFHHSSYCFIT